MSCQFEMGTQDYYLIFYHHLPYYNFQLIIIVFELILIFIKLNKIVVAITKQLIIINFKLTKYHYFIIYFIEEISWVQLIINFIVIVIIIVSILITNFNSRVLIIIVLNSKFEWIILEITTLKIHFVIPNIIIVDY